MEPGWTKKIPSTLICDWFYFFFLVNAFVMAALVVSVLYLFVSNSFPKALKPYALFLVFLKLLLAGTSTLFYYLICDRALIAERPAN